MYTDLETFARAAAGNDVLLAGLALAALGASYGALRAAYGVLARLIGLRLWFAVTLDSRSAAYGHLMRYVGDSGALARSRRVQADVQAEGAEFAPAPGAHWLWLDGRLVHLIREISDKTQVATYAGRGPMEVVTLRILGGSRARVAAWLAEGAARASRRSRIGPGLHIYSGGYWAAMGDVPGRGLDTVVVADDRLEQLLADVRWFYGAARWYADRGVPWRRGYLLYGPPGTGKSSVIRAIASELGRDIATLDIARAGLADDELRQSMVEAPRGAILAIEDIDAAFAGREAGDAQPGITFSGLLNAIDGVAAQEGRALFMTTNHRERLDPALIRPGRADLHVELGLVGAAEAARLFARFHPGEPALAARFAAAVGSRRVSPAELQGWLMAHHRAPEAAADACGLRVIEPVAAE